MKACAAVLALLSLAAARAEVKLADAVISDVQQQCYTTGTTDKWMSWAAADANIIQAWQDVYAPAHDAGRVPPNGSGTSATRGTAVYNALLSGMDLDGYAYLGTGLSLWMQGKEYLMPLGTATFPIASPTAGSFPGYYVGQYGQLGTDEQGLPTNACFADKYGTELPTSSSSRVTRAELKEVLDNTFAYQGHVAGLGIYNRDVTTGATTMHALTCWGYETDSDGSIQTLLLTDSYDETGLFKATLTEDGRIMSEDGIHLFDKGVFYLKSVTALNPVSVSAEADTSVGGHGNTALNEATELNTAVSAGEGHILAASAKLSVQGADGDAVRVGQGAYGFLSDVELTDNNGTGLAAEGSTEVHGASVTISGNARGVQASSTLLMDAASIEIAGNTAAGNGGGMSAEAGAAVQLGGFGAEVSFADNSAALGGGLYNAGIVRVADDTNSVSFSGNSAQQGSAIYNTGSLSISNLWDALTVEASPAGQESSLIYNSGTMELAWQLNGMSFSGGTCAIDNDGVLYLGTDEDADAVFDGNSLRSAGLTYIGMDAEEVLGYGEGGAVFREEGREASIRLLVGEDGYAENPVEFSGVADAVSLGGLNAQSFLKNARVTADGAYSISDMALCGVAVQDTADALTLTNVVLDDTCTLAAASLSLEDVTLLLTLERLAEVPVSGVAELDASGIFTEGELTGSLTLSCLGLSDALLSAGASALLVNFGDAAQVNFSSLAVEGMTYAGMQGNKALFTIPEPAAPALLLLGATALLLRRRR